MAGERTRERGELESQIMRVLWENDEPLSGREIQTLLEGKQPAYTTLLTVLTRLETKGLVLRSGPSPRRMRFAPTRSGGEQASLRMADALDEATDREAALLRFAGSLGPDDVELLRQAIDSRRKER